MTLELVFNPKALRVEQRLLAVVRARAASPQGVLLANGDTVHPASVEETLLGGARRRDILLALDDVKPLGEEEMKVHVTPTGRMTRINKALDPGDRAGRVHRR